MSACTRPEWQCQDTKRWQHGGSGCQEPQYRLMLFLLFLASPSRSNFVFYVLAFNFFFFLFCTGWLFLLFFPGWQCTSGLLFGQTGWLLFSFQVNWFPPNHGLLAWISQVNCCFSLFHSQSVAQVSWFVVLFFPALPHWLIIFAYPFAQNHSHRFVDCCFLFYAQTWVNCSKPFSVFKCQVHLHRLVDCCFCFAALPWSIVFFWPCLFTPGNIARWGDSLVLSKFAQVCFLFFSYTALVNCHFCPGVMQKQVFVFFHKAQDTRGSNSMPMVTASLHCHSSGMAQTHVNCCLIVVFPHFVSPAFSCSDFSSYSQVDHSFCFLLHHAGW